MSDTEAAFVKRVERMLTLERLLPPKGDTAGDDKLLAAVRILLKNEFRPHREWKAVEIDAFGAALRKQLRTLR